MKIAVLGSKGFVGRNLADRFKYTGHEVFELNRATIDLLDSKAVRHWLENNRPDVVVNAAAIMGHPDLLKDTYNNLGIFMNFYDNAHNFGRMINLASGAEYDREQSLEKISESRIYDRLPADSYGFGQNIKSRLSSQRDNYYTLRIFNCFGPGEPKTRLIPRFLASDAEFKLSNDRYFDYFGIDDLYTVVKHFSTATYRYTPLRDVNCVYLDKVRISEFLSMFCKTRGISNDSWSIESTSELHYTGSGDKLANLGIDLLGLEKCLERYR